VIAQDFKKIGSRCSPTKTIFLVCFLDKKEFWAAIIRSSGKSLKNWLGIRTLIDQEYQIFEHIWRQHGAAKKT